MNTFTFGIKNMGRRKGRASLAILGIAVGVMLITSLLFIMDGLESGIAESVELLSGNLIVQKKGAVDLPFSIVNLSLVDPLKANKDVRAVSPEIYVVQRIDEGGLLGFVSAIGVTESYREMVSPAYIKEGEVFHENDTGKATVGIKLADRLNIGLGDTLSLDTYEFTITGIFETNTLIDASTLLVPIEDARRMSGLPKEVVNVIEVRPVSPDRADAIREYVEARYDGYEVIYPQDLLEEGEEIMDTLRGVVWIVSSIAVIVGSIGIANAMLMSVLERTPEIGVLKATGWSNFDVGYSVVLEAFGIGLIGGTVGIILGIGSSFAAENIIPNLPVRLSLIPILQSFIFAIGLSILSGIYPALKAGRIPPIVAIRGE